MTCLRYAGTVSVGESRPSTAPVLRLTAYGPGPTVYGEDMGTFDYVRLRAKARFQTAPLMRRYRVRVWWGLESWTEAELREAWGR